MISILLSTLLMQQQPLGFPYKHRRVGAGTQSYFAANFNVIVDDFVEAKRTFAVIRIQRSARSPTDAYDHQGVNFGSPSGSCCDSGNGYGRERWGTSGNQSGNTALVTTQKRYIGSGGDRSDRINCEGSTDNIHRECTKIGQNLLGNSDTSYNFSAGIMGCSAGIIGKTKNNQKKGLTFSW